MATNLPVSKTNIATLIALEHEYGVMPTTASIAKQIAYDANSLARQQTLTPNAELRGTRKSAQLVVGPKNPGGPVAQHLTAQTAPLFYEALLGARTTTEVLAAGCTVSGALNTPPAAGNVDDGSHYYKIVITKTGTYTGYTLPSEHSTVVTVADKSTNGKVLVTRTGGALPTGWTWDIYRTQAGEDPDTPVSGYHKVNPTALGAAVLTYVDNIADATIDSNPEAPSSSTAGDYDHVIKVGDTLPSYFIERAVTFLDATTTYIQSRGCQCDRGRIGMRSTGFFDFAGDWLIAGNTNAATSFETGTATDWRSGEKLHHAMIGSGKVKLGTYGALTEFLKFQEMSLDHANNLDRTDYPMGLQGDRGSSTPLNAITTITGTLKVTDAEALAYVQSPSTIYAAEVQHDFAYFGHYLKHEFRAMQFDPMDPPVAGQGIWTATFTAHGITETTTNEQVVVTVRNGEAGTVYDAPAA